MLRLVIAAALALALILTLEVSPAAAASPKTCRVTNTDSGRTYPRLQQAVDAAKPGARLVVMGTCHGGTLIDKDLVIKGKRTGRLGLPVLDGDGNVRVLVIKPGANANLRNLHIREGWWKRGYGTLTISRGGGISNKGRLTLRDVAVSDGGGIHNAGTLRIRGWAVASSLHNAGRLVFAQGSRVTMQANGGSLSNDGDLRMDGSSLSAQQWGWWTLSVSNAGILAMDGTSRISDLTVANSGTLTMNDASSIHGSRWRRTRGPMGDWLQPEPSGGGVHNTGTLTMNDASSIHGNSTGSGVGETGLGGGVYNAGHLTMTGSSRITENRAGQGGGLYNASGGTLVGVNCAPQSYANVYGNTPDDCYFEP